MADLFKLYYEIRQHGYVPIQYGKSILDRYSVFKLMKHFTPSFDLSYTTHGLHKKIKRNNQLKQSLNCISRALSRRFSNTKTGELNGISHQEKHRHMTPRLC